MLNLLERLPWQPFRGFSLQLNLFNFDQRLFLAPFSIIIIHFRSIRNSMHYPFAPLTCMLRIPTIRQWPRITVDILKTQEWWCSFYQVRWILIWHIVLDGPFVFPLDFQHLVHHLRVTFLELLFLMAVRNLRCSGFTHCCWSLFVFLLYRPVFEHFYKLVDLISITDVINNLHIFTFFINQILSVFFL